MRSLKLCIVCAAAFLAAACSSPSAPSNSEPTADMGADLAADATTDEGTDAETDVGQDAATPTDMSEPPSATTAEGPVVGAWEEGLAVFRGIPYAAPPVGDLRWKAPTPTSWTEPLEAFEFGEKCIQPKITYTSLVGSEDCLYLNVWAPPGAEELPVMVWLHGGGFNQGSPDEPTYHGHDLAQEGVVVVTVAYRLGALGFLSHPELTTEAGSSGNFGLMDQRAAMEWVQRNVRSFGGDPGNVTLFGESAGSISTCLHLAGGSGQTLFHRAVLQSGPCDLIDLPDLENAEDQGRRLSAAVGCAQAADELTCLRSYDPVELSSILGYRIATLFGPGESWIPVRDGDMIADDLHAALAANANVPVLIGTNQNEGNLIRPGAQFDLVEVTYDGAIDDAYGPDADAVRIQYPLANYDTELDAVVDIVTDHFVCRTRRVARDIESAGQPVFMYHFTQTFVTALGDYGAMHGAELPFVFGTELGFAPLKDTDQPLSSLMQRFWTRFAATGEPNGGDDPSWPAYTTADDQHVVLGTDVSTDAGLHQEACNFWDSLAP